MGSREAFDFRETAIGILRIRVGRSGDGSCGDALSAIRQDLVAVD